MVTVLFYSTAPVSAVHHVNGKSSAHLEIKVYLRRQINSDLRLKQVKSSAG